MAAEDRRQKRTHSLIKHNLSMPVMGKWPHGNVRPNAYEDVVMPDACAFTKIRLHLGTPKVLQGVHTRTDHAGVLAQLAA